MEKAKVYFSDLRTSPTSNLLDKMERLLKRAGIGQLPLKDSFTAIKIHFGEPGNLAYIRPNYAARMANLLRSFGAKPFLTDCNTLYSGRRSNAVDHLQSAMENGFNPISAQCQVIIADGLKGTDYREIPIDGEYCPAPKIYNPQIQISAESETKRSIFRKRDKTKRSKKESAQHSKSRNKSFVMTSVSAL